MEGDGGRGRGGVAAGDHQWRVHSWEKEIGELFGHLSYAFHINFF